MNSRGHVKGSLREFGKGGVSRQLRRGRGTQGGAQDGELHAAHLSLNGPQYETPGPYVSFRRQFPERGNAKAAIPEGARRR